MGRRKRLITAHGKKFHKKNVWIVVPAYNESKYLDTVLKKLQKQTKNIIVVDDGSKDDTTKIAQKKAAHVLTHSVNLGKGAALKTGCDWAFSNLGAEAVVVLDGDDQHDPAQIDLFIQPLMRGAEVVFGVRDLFVMPVIRQFGNQLGSWMIFLLFGRYLPDIPSGYKSFTKVAYQKLRWYSHGYSVEMEMAARVAKYRLVVVSVPIPTIYHDLTRGMTVLDTLYMFGLVISWRFSL